MREPCYWCGVGIENPDSWPCCHRKECQVQTMRWFLHALGRVPERPKLSKQDLLSAQVLQFVSTLGRPTEPGGETIEWVVPPAARTRPLSIAPKDKAGFVAWALGRYGGHAVEELPTYLDYQIKRRIERSKLPQIQKLQIEKEKEDKKAAKLRRILRKEWL